MPKFLFNFSPEDTPILQAMVERIAKAGQAGDTNALSAWGKCFAFAVPKVLRVSYNSEGDEKGASAKEDMRRQYSNDPLIARTWLANALKDIGVTLDRSEQKDGKLVYLPNSIWQPMVLNFSKLLENAFSKNEKEQA